MIVGFIVWLFWNIMNFETPASIPGLTASFVALMVGDFMERRGYGFEKQAIADNPAEQE